MKHVDAVVDALMSRGCSNTEFKLRMLESLRSTRSWKFCHAPQDRDGSCLASLITPYAYEIVRGVFQNDRQPGVLDLYIGDILWPVHCLPLWDSSFRDPTPTISVGESSVDLVEMFGHNRRFRVRNGVLLDPLPLLIFGNLVVDYPK